MAPIHHKPVFVIVPGSGIQPAHYALLMYLLMESGYGVLSAMLPSCGTGKEVTIEDDADYIRNRMVLPVIDDQERDVIMLAHSYGGLPASAAVAGLSKEDRAKAGKSSSVLGQIYVASLICGEGSNLFDAFGGQFPPHVRLNVQNHPPPFICLDSSETDYV